MHVEDGDELPLEVRFEEKEEDGTYWYASLAVLPRVGDTVIIGAARAGLSHRVTQIIHTVGGGSHHIVVEIERIK